MSNSEKIYTVMSKLNLERTVFIIIKKANVRPIRRVGGPCAKGLKNSSSSSCLYIFKDLSITL